jgi:hypothetical protein
MNPDPPVFGHFYCAFYVESICVYCSMSVAKAPTRKELEPEENSHVCSPQKST